MTPLKERILQALIDHENAKPRNQQVRLGPSELGGCREYMRNIMIGAPMQDSGDVWPTAAVMGTLMGTHMEAVLAERMGALTEVGVTTTLPNGIRVSGHADVVLPEYNAVVDAKTKDTLDAVLNDGASLDNRVQVSVYTLGLCQSGVLSDGATAHLIYVDRSGKQQFLHEEILEWDDILRHVDIAVDRMTDVLDAQEHIDRGEVEYARDLRDKTPPFCYNERVLCPFRDLCWKGSEWVPDTEITDPEVIATVERYVTVRDALKADDAMRREYRERLIGVTGVTPSGWAVTWSGTEASPALFVTKVKEAS